MEPRDSSPMRIDFHVHAFPESLAERAMVSLNERIDDSAFHSCGDGRIASLIAELDANGIDRAVVCSIATRPKQWRSILDWSLSLRDGGSGEEAAKRIIPLASVHPADPEAEAHLAEVAAAGIPGVKLHPYYQEFELDAPAILDFLRMARDQGLLVVTHAGFDVGFARDLLCDPIRIRRVAEAVPGLDLVAAHLGGWSAWDEVERELIGLPGLYIETSFAPSMLGAGRMGGLLRRHPADHVLFGTDWPWRPHAPDLAAIGSLPDPAEWKAGLLGGNAVRLLRRHGWKA